MRRLACFLKEASKALLKTQRLQLEVSSKIRKRGIDFTDDEEDEVEDALNEE